MRGNIDRIGMRIDAKPESCPSQNGELADSASSSGSSCCRPSSAAIAAASLGTATCTWSAIVGSRFAITPMVACSSR